MRDSLIQLLRRTNLAGFSVTEELPSTENGLELYLKNPKTIYVDRETTEETPVITTLNGHGVAQRTTSVTAYFSTDAKKPAAALNRIIEDIRNLKNSIEAPGANQRNCFVRQEYIEDLLSVAVEYQFTRIT